MTTEKIDLSALRVGDKVTLTFEVTGIRQSGGVHMKHGTDEFYVGNAHTYHGTVERAPRPLEVGDRVRWHNVPASIVGIHRTKAWVLLDLGGSDLVVHLSDLTREASHDH